MRGRLLAVIASITLLATGCAGGTATSSPSAAKAPLPAGVLPSAISKQVCGREAQREIAASLGETAAVSAPTWVDHLYSCDYRYRAGSMAVSVKELSSWGQTATYFGALAGSMGKTRDLEGLGQGAFQATDGSVVVRKDWKVLVVDPGGLPPQFGVPPTGSGDVAVTVADVILGCWAGD